MATILQIANADANLTFFSRGLKVTGLEQKLNESGPFTLLSPVNLAFRKLGSNVEELFLPANSDKLVNLLSGHIILGKNMLHDLTNGKKLRTINGKEIVVNIKNGSVCLNDAKILSKDRQGKNGVVHSLDTLYP
jgi:uncharacterized surface protein with fasciclin (FAS1) repeats